MFYLICSSLQSSLEAFIFHFSMVGRQERGGDVRQRSPSPGLEPGRATLRTIASAHGRVLNPYTTNAAPN
ncbi:hypothetical protein AMECASPLE_037444 [Ameca splendens]|uniref:Secreted protein n=1 Tax=Ameca splendens TaxID=208324 RepID=A0ABV0Z5U0_9TELE